ncbi:hypothetical protein [Streptomyces blattellae]|uniref:hypothetical protein n=1 Tax=Streptomyces blattellae TaxID=2569855 RepID=UPI0012B8C4F3|nr:hypothetical protein [Streptomyces blattellae]
MTGSIARWGVALGLGVLWCGLGVLWWWAALRLALAPDAGVLEGAVAAGGWGLSLLPVHCVPKGRAPGAVQAGRWREAGRVAWRVALATRASPPRRSDAGSGPS